MSPLRDNALEKILSRLEVWEAHEIRQQIRDVGLAGFFAGFIAGMFVTIMLGFAYGVIL